MRDALVNGLSVQQCFLLQKGSLFKSFVTTQLGTEGQRQLCALVPLPL